MDTPREIIEAAHKALLEGYTKYAPAPGYPMLREALARKLSKHNGIACDPNGEILVTQGSTEALYVTVNTLLEPSDEAILLAPYYPPYDSLIRASGAVPRHVNSTAGAGWLPAIEDIESAINDKTRIILVNTPNNPTGEIYPREFLEKVGRLAADHDLVMVSDEAYEALVFDGNSHISSASIDSIRSNVVSLFSFSKTFAMTGWRLGYIVGPRDFIKKAGTIHNLVVAHVSSHIQIAAVKALDDWARLSAPIIKELDKRRQTLVKQLNELPGVSCNMPKGTFYAFPDFSAAAPGVTSQQLADLFIGAGVGTSPGNFFGECAEGFQRLSFSKVSAAQIDEATKRIAKVLKSR